MLIDTSFDFRGIAFELRDTTPGVYLHHRSGLGEFELSSDAVIATFIRYAATAQIIERIPHVEILVRMEARDDRIAACALAP